MELGQALDCIDFDTAAEVAGGKFVFLKRAAALLEVALVNYALQKVVAQGFVPMMTPDLVRESVLEKCGFQPRAENTQVRAETDAALWQVRTETHAALWQVRAETDAALW